MKIIRVFGLIINVLIFLFIIMIILVDYNNNTGDFLDLPLLFVICIVLMLVSSVLPFVSINQVFSKIFTKEKNIQLDLNVLDQNMDLLKTSDLANPLREENSNRWRFWVVTSGIIQVVISLIWFGMSYEYFNFSNLGDYATIMFLSIFLIFLSGIISIFYIKK